ncbi:MAG: MFS transporter [Solirubrobacteraceae bacterium]
MSSYLRVLRHPSFRYLFYGQTASAVGDCVVLVALALFVTERTHSPTDLGLVLAAQSLPLVALVLLGGVWADRLPRRRIMIAADVTRAALHGTLAALIFSGSVRLWEIIAIEASFGAARAFFQPAYSGLIPQTVPESLIQDARALTSSTANVAAMIGPALGAALVLGVGAGNAFAFDAGTFVVSALLLARVRARSRGAPAPAGSMLADLRAGWREVRSRAWVWVTIAAFTGALMCVLAPWYALAPTIAGHVYGSIGVFGLFESLAGLGAVCGALAGLRWRPVHPMRAGLLLVLAWPVTAGLFALGAPLVLVLAGALMLGFGFSLFGVWWETALARHIPPHALSRVSAWDWMGSLALLPLGYALTGPLASAFGARTVLAAGSAIGLVLLALALTPRSTRELTDTTSPAAGRLDCGVV